MRERTDKAKRTGRRVPPPSTPRSTDFEDGVALGIRLELTRQFPEILDGTASPQQAQSALELIALMRFAIGQERPEHQPFLDSFRAKAAEQEAKKQK